MREVSMGLNMAPPRPLKAKAMPVAMPRRASNQLPMMVVMGIRVQKAKPIPFASPST